MPKQLTPEELADILDLVKGGDLDSNTAAEMILAKAYPPKRPYKTKYDRDLEAFTASGGTGCMY